jgi:hypothetical protein
MERRGKVIEQVKQLDSQITALEACIRERTAKLRIAQDKWHDWEAGVLRGAIGHDQVTLHNLKIRRASLAPMQEKRASAIFYGSNA